MDARSRRRTGKAAHRTSAARPRTVALGGSSLLISSIGAGLEGTANVNVVRTKAGGWDVRQIRELHVDAVVFELASALSGPALKLLKAHPALVLVGVDSQSNAVLVLSGRSRRVRSARELLRVVEAHLGDATAAARPCSSAVVTAKRSTRQPASPGGQGRG